MILSTMLTELPTTLLAILLTDLLARSLTIDHTHPDLRLYSFWAIGNLCSTYATYYLGQSVGYPLTQTCIVVAGLWGGEYRVGTSRTCRRRTTHSLAHPLTHSHTHPRTHALTHSRSHCRFLSSTFFRGAPRLEKPVSVRRVGLRDHRRRHFARLIRLERPACCWWTTHPFFCLT